MSSLAVATRRKAARVPFYQVVQQTINKQLQILTSFFILSPQQQQQQLQQGDVDNTSAVATSTASSSAPTVSAITTGGVATSAVPVIGTGATSSAVSTSSV